jgi:hypothetical protein
MRSALSCRRQRQITKQLEVNNCDPLASSRASRCGEPSTRSPHHIVPNKASAFLTLEQNNKFDVVVLELCTTTRAAISMLLKGQLGGQLQPCPFWAATIMAPLIRDYVMHVPKYIKIKNQNRIDT